MREKGLAPILLILGIVLLIAAAAGAYYFGKSSSTPAVVTSTTSSNPISSATPKPSIATTSATTVSETANWKTYTNEKYGISISYPSDWKLDTENDYLIFSIYNPTQPDSRLELFNNFQGGFCEGSEVKTTEIESSDGLKGEKRECTSTIAVNFMKNGNNFWLITNGVNDKNKSTFNQILSTFKFQ